MFLEMFICHINYHSKESENTLGQTKNKSVYNNIDLPHICNKKLNSQSSAHDVFLKPQSPTHFPATISWM